MRSGERGWVATFYGEHVSAIRAFQSLVIVLIVWEILGRTLWLHSPAIAAPSDIVKSGYDEALSGTLWRNVTISGEEFFIGFALACIFGVALGVLAGTSDAVNDYIDPWLSAIYATPTFALAPIFILWLGIGIESKVAVVFLLAIFPIVINTAVGIRSADQTLVEVARSFRASQWQIFRKVLIPCALPFIVSGIRLGIGRGVIGIVAGEFFGSLGGLGYQILLASQQFDPASLFVALIILAGFGVLSVTLLQAFERRLTPWRR